jgi:hypothetical protein
MAHRDRPRPASVVDAQIYRASQQRMVIEEEILARVRAAKAWDKQARLEDFQVKAAENGFVPINLKTRRAQLLYDDDSELNDLEQLFPETRKHGRPLL